MVVFFKLILLKPRWFALVSPCLLLVILMLNLRLFPVLLKVFLLVGMLIRLLLILWVLVLLLMLLVGLVGRRVLVLVEISLWAVPGALAASQDCFVTDRWFTPHFSVVARFRISAWMADVACSVACQPIWPACWLDTPYRSSSSSTRVVQDVWDIYREELGVVPEDVVLSLRDAVSRSSVDDFWSYGVVVLRQVCFEPMLLLEVRLKLAALPFLVEVCYVFVAGVWEVELLVAGVLVGCIVLVRVMRLIVTVPSFLFILLFLPFYSFVDVLSPLLMFLRVLGTRGLLSLGGMLY